jgi:hypothetical protein
MMRTTMNNIDDGRVDQKDRELEELLCLAYLFTHTKSVDGQGESENPLTDRPEIYPTRFM